MTGSNFPEGYRRRDGRQSPAVRMDNSLVCPQTITTDQGRQFESQLFHSLAIMCGINLSHAMAFRLAANGLVERILRSRQAAIMWRAQERWTEVLPLVLGMHPAFKTYRRPCRSSSNGKYCVFLANFWQHRPPPGIHRSSLDNCEHISSNCGQSQWHVTPHPLYLYTKTWQILLMSSSGRVQNGAPFNRPKAALSRSWSGYENRYVSP